MSESVVQLPKWAKKFEPPAPYKVAHGGRAEGAKSETVAGLILLKAAAKPKARVLCAREFQKSTKESVLATLKAVAERMGLQHKFGWTENTFFGLGGQEFIFIGLHANISAIKSLHGIDLAWVEEAETVSKESWNILLPTLRKEDTELYVTFNPRDEEDATTQLWMKNPPPGAIVVKVTHEDNPFMPTRLKQQMEHDFKKDADTAAHVWKGEFRKNSQAQIFANKYELAEFEPQTDWDGPWYGLDFGFAQDPLSAHEYWAKGNTLYVYRESWGCGVELNDIPGKLRRDMPKLGTKLIRADNSRPESISHLKGLGLNVVACKKWPGCVEDGVAYLKSLTKIVIHSTNCPEAAREARYYSYKVDKNTGKVLNAIVDAWNHFWDECRYALENAIAAQEHNLVFEHEEQASISPELDAMDDGMPVISFV